MLSAYSAKWFTVYYFCLGMLGLFAGWYCFVRTQEIIHFIEERTFPNQPPSRLRIFLRYFFVFTLPTLVLSFFPFSLIELAFSLWCLLMIYLLGSLLLRWKSLHPLLMKKSAADLKKHIRITGVIMLSLSGVMFLLFYRIIQTSF